MRIGLLISSWLLLILTIAGCGGGGGGAPVNSAAVTLDIAWSARTRSVTAPSSALSAVVFIPAAKLDGTDFSWTINRDAGTISYNKTYTAPEQVKLGSFTVTVKFYAQADGQGPVVGTATQVVSIEAGHSLGTLITSGTIASTTVAAEQVVRIGHSQDLVFTAKDGSGDVIAVSPGSASFTQVNGSDKMTITPAGIATGVAVGPSSVTVTVDGVKSPTVTVLSGPGFALTELPPLPGDVESAASAINSVGDVVGTSTSTNGTRHGVVWHGGQPTAVGDIPGHPFFFPSDINASGTVVGWASTTDDTNQQTVGFMWRAGSYLALPTNAYTPKRINDAGQMIGDNWIYDGTSVVQPVPPSGDGATILRFTDLNNSGQAVCDATFPAQDGSGNSQTLLFVYKNGNFTPITLPAGTDDRTIAISNSGKVVGTSYSSANGTTPFIWRTGTVAPLITAEALGVTFPFAINDAEIVVGQAVRPGPIGSRSQPAFAVIKGYMFDLNGLVSAPDAFLEVAIDVNDKGQIVGSKKTNGKYKAFLLTPEK